MGLDIGIFGEPLMYMLPHLTACIENALRLVEESLKISTGQSSVS